MRKTSPFLRNETGFTLVEVCIILMISAVLASIVIANYESLTAKARYTKTKSDMNAIAYAGYMDYSNNLGVWDVASNPWTPPPSITGSGVLPKWPESSCPGYYYSWDNAALFGLNVVRVSLRRFSDETAVWSYCVNTFGGGDCDAADMYNPGVKPVEISTATINHFFCNE